MNRNWLLLLLALPLLLPAGCQQQPSLVRHQEAIAGINHTLWIAGSDQKTAQRAVGAVFSELRLLSNFTHPVESKPISRTNVLLRSGEWFSVNPSMTGILKESVRYFEKTDGLYNPAGLGALRQEWGLYADPDLPIPPKEKELQALLADLPTMDDIHFDAIRLRGDNKRVRLDFDYLAYGYAIDMEIQHLQELGIKNARLQIGRVDRVIGTLPDTGKRAGPAVCTREIPVEPGTSRPRERNAILSLRTGHPIDQVSAISVAAGNASDASVACWVLLIGNADEWPELSKQLGVIEARITDADGNIHVLGGQ